MTPLTLEEDDRDRDVFQTYKVKGEGDVSVALSAVCQSEQWFFTVSTLCVP